MASWLQAQLNAAQDLLEGIDKTVAGGAAKAQHGGQQDPPSPESRSSSVHNGISQGFRMASGPGPFASFSDTRQDSISDHLPVSASITSPTQSANSISRLRKGPVDSPGTSWGLGVTRKGGNSESSAEPKALPRTLDISRPSSSLATARSNSMRAGDEDRRTAAQAPESQSAAAAATSTSSSDPSPNTMAASSPSSAGLATPSLPSSQAAHPPAPLPAPAPAPAPTIPSNTTVYASTSASLSTSPGTVESGPTAAEKTAEKTFEKTAEKAEEKTLEKTAEKAADETIMQYQPSETQVWAEEPMPPAPQPMPLPRDSSATLQAAVLQALSQTASTSTGAEAGHVTQGVTGGVAQNVAESDSTRATDGTDRQASQHSLRGGGGEGGGIQAELKDKQVEDGAAPRSPEGVAAKGADGKSKAAAGHPAMSLASISAAGLFEELADGLLGTVSSSRQAPPSQGAGGGGAGERESALSRVVEQQRKRLEATRNEADQLEEMLHKAEARAESQAAMVAQLNLELGLLQESKTMVESSFQSKLSNLKSLNSELSARCDLLQQQALRAEAQVAALEENNRVMMEREKGLEGGMLEALRSELAAAEARLEVERKAHQSTKMSAVSRERELEQLLGETSNALADTQRRQEDSLAELGDLKDQVALLEVSRKELLEQVAAAAGGDAPGGVPFMRSSSSEASMRIAELEGLRADAAAQRRALKHAEAGKLAAEKQLQELTGELDMLRVQVEKFLAKKDTTELEAQLREASDMLCLKQSQIEKIASDKAAATLRLERELGAAREEILKMRHASGGLSGGYVTLNYPGHEGSSSSSNHDVIPMDALGAPYRRLAASNNRMGKAIKAAGSFLDISASASSFFLRQYPLARLIIFGYLVLLHLYVYALIARMQTIGVKLDQVALAADKVPGAWMDSMNRM